MENRFRNPRVRKRLYKDYSEDLPKYNTNVIINNDETDCDESSDNTEITPKTTYNFRDLPNTIYHKDDDKNSSSENVCTDVSEYTPCLQDQNHASTPSSSLGGDSECIEDLQSKISRCPSVISNVSTYLSETDFVASSSEIFKADSFGLNTPKTMNETKSKEHINLVDITLKDRMEFYNKLDCSSDFITTKSIVNSSPRGEVTTTGEAMQEKSLNSCLHPKYLSQISDRKSDLQDTEFDTTLKPADNITDSDLDQTLCCSKEIHLNNETNKLSSSVDAILLENNNLPSSSFIKPYTFNETIENELVLVHEPSSVTGPSYSMAIVPYDLKDNIPSLPHIPPCVTDETTVNNQPVVTHNNIMFSSSTEPRTEPRLSVTIDIEPCTPEHEYNMNSPSLIEPCVGAIEGILSLHVAETKDNDAVIKHVPPIDTDDTIIASLDIIPCALGNTATSIIDSYPANILHLTETEGNVPVLSRVSSLAEPLQISTLQIVPSAEPENNLPEDPVSSLLAPDIIKDVPENAVNSRDEPDVEANTPEIDVAINAEPISQEEESITETSNKPTRKRKRDEQNWKCNKNKKLKNLGLPYTSKRTKKIHPAKTVKEECNCKKKCGERFTPEKRNDIFNKYYKLGNHEYQWQFINRNIEVEDIKRTTINRKCNRNQTLKYYFLDGEDKVQVCKKFFLNTLNISDTVIFTALEKVKNEETLTDGRGHHNNRPHKTTSLTEESVLKHIKLFPTVEAHYVRKDSQKLYLQEDLNISKMYRLYKKWFPAQDFICQKATARQYRKIFNTMFNYSFFKPKKDMCPTCTRYLQADNEKKLILQNQYDKHITNKDIVRDIKNTEKESTNDLKTIAIFDLEKVLYIPKSDVSVFYYKRKYPVYNFTVFDAGRKLGYCYMWHMKIAKRGAIEIGSCLLKFFKNEHDRAVTDISLYSDGCPGQNKNRFIFALHLYAATKFHLSITHRFFETGHSQNEGDSMHACIERELKKNKVLYTPEQIYAVAMNAKVTGEKYKVIEMDQSDFFDIKQLIEGRNWTHDTNGNKIAWSNIMEVAACHTHEDVLKFKYSFEEDYNELNTRLLATRSVRAPRGARVRGGRGPSRGVRTRGGQALNVTATLTSESQIAPELQRAYNQAISVPKALHSDLLSLCKNDDIPRHYHDFYMSLHSENDEGTEANRNLVENDDD